MHKMMCICVVRMQSRCSGWSLPRGGSARACAVYVSLLLAKPAVLVVTSISSMPQGSLGLVCCSIAGVSLDAMPLLLFAAQNDDDPLPMTSAYTADLSASALPVTARRQQE